MSSPIESVDAVAHSLWLRPGIAVIPQGEQIQLRAGDEDIFVFEVDESEVVLHWLRRLAAGSATDELRGEVPDDLAATWNAVMEQLAGAQPWLDRRIDPADDIGKYLSHVVSNGAAAKPPEGVMLLSGNSPSCQLLATVLREQGIETLIGDEKGQRGRNGSDELEPTAEVCLWEQANLTWAMRINDRAIESQRPCLFVDLSHGRHATLGPFFVPGEGACLRCYRQRWRENTSTLEEFDAAESAMLASPLPAFGTLPAYRYQMVGLASAELFAFLTRHRPLRTLNRILTVDFEGMQMAGEPCWQVPWCGACGRGVKS